MPEIYPHTRLRQSPYYAATIAEGATSFTTYNRMLLPLGYSDAEEEYWRLIRGVSLWDVACERQVQIMGPDAARLVQILCPRDMSNCAVNQGKYVPLCNHKGTIINDPIVRDAYLASTFRGDEFDDQPAKKRARAVQSRP